MSRADPMHATAARIRGVKLQAPNPNCDRLPRQSRPPIDPGISQAAHRIDFSGSIIHDSLLKRANYVEVTVKKTRALWLLVTVAAFGTLPYAASAENSVQNISGDKDAVWLVTDDNRLIYCWWPQDPSRPEARARCKTVDRFNLDRLK